MSIDQSAHMLGATPNITGLENHPIQSLSVATPAVLRSCNATFAERRLHVLQRPLPMGNQLVA